MWLLHWLGMDNASGRVYLAWSGWGGDLSILAGAATVLRQMVKHHRARMAQSATQQAERLAQAGLHHREHLELLRRHHSQQLDALTVPAVPASPLAAEGEKLTPDTVRKVRRQRTTPGGAK